MLEAARQAVQFTDGCQRIDLDTDLKTAFALVRCIEVIGEAATNVSPECKIALPQIPWKDAARMRNRLIHAYFDVDYDRVWDTVTVNLPELIGLLAVIPEPLEDAEETES
jgi:uncharacterized protein with HEPN domain